MTDANYALDGLEPLLAQSAGTSTAISVKNAWRYVDMRCEPSNAGAMSRISTVLGQEVPREPNTFSDGAQTVYWLGPDEWLIAGDAKVTTLFTELRRETDGYSASFVDVSDGMVCMTLAGSSVRELLAKGCTLDLDAQQFGPGQCAQTLLAKAPVLIACAKHDASFEIHVRRSFAEYAARWLHHAAAEFGIGRQTT